MGAVQIRPDLIDHFRRHPGMPVFTDDLMTLAKRIRPDINRPELLGIISAIIREGVLPGLACNVRGVKWTYHPVAQHGSDKLYRLHSETSSGKLILEGDDGKLYVAKELDI